MCQVAGGTQHAGLNLVSDGHTYKVAGPGLIRIAVNHGAAELVMDLDRLANVDDYKRARRTCLL